MNKKLYTLAALVLLSLSACNPDDDDDNDDDILNGSFHAVIDGVDWDAQPDNVGAVVTNFGTGPSVSINGTNENDSAHFFLGFPYFNGSDTVINGNTDGVVLRFQGAHVWDSGDGVLEVARTTQDGIETYTGTFHGNFIEFLDSTNVRVITEGAFTAKRLI